MAANKLTKTFDVKVCQGKRLIETVARNVSYAIALTKRSEQQRKGTLTRSVYIEPHA